MNRRTLMAMVLAIGTGLAVFRPLLPAWAAALATITLAENIVEHIEPGSKEWLPAPEGTELQAGHEVKTGPRSRAEFTYSDGASMRLSSSTSFKVIDPGRRVVQLLLGKMYAKVNPGGGVRIQTPSALVVIGEQQRQPAAPTPAPTAVAAAPTPVPPSPEPTGPPRLASPPPRPEPTTVAEATPVPLPEPTAAPSTAMTPAPEPTPAIAAVPTPVPAALTANQGGVTEIVLEVLSDQSTKVTVLRGKVLLFPPEIGAITLGQGSQPGAQDTGSPGTTPAATGGETSRAGPQGTTPAGQSGPQAGTVARPQSPAQSIVVSAGQGAIARPDQPMSIAYAVDLNVVLSQESGVLPTSASVIVPPLNIAPAPSPVVNTNISTSVQLQNPANDPKILQGSPTTGNIKLIIK